MHWNFIFGSEKYYEQITRMCFAKQVLFLRNGAYKGSLLLCNFGVYVSKILRFQFMQICKMSFDKKRKLQTESALKCIEIFVATETDIRDQTNLQSPTLGPWIVTAKSP